MSSKVKCPICGHVLSAAGNTYECHDGCLCRLPMDLVDSKCDVLPVVVLGMSSVGKSCYIGAILKALSLGDGERFFWEKAAVDIDTDKDIREKYISAFNDGEPRKVIESTRSVNDVAVSRIVDPLLVKMDFDDCEREIFGMRASFRLFGHHFFGKKREIRLCIRDVAGEDMVNNRNRLFEAYPILRYAKALFMMVEPQQLPGVNRLLREKLPDEKRRSSMGLKSDMHSNERDVIDLLNEIRKGYLGIRKCPLAICVSKTDSLAVLDKFSEINNNPLFKATSKVSKGCIDLSDIEELNDYIQEELLVAGSNSRSLLEQLKDVFEYVCFFGVSAFGIDAITEEGKKVRGTISSKRILEPVLWALWQEGYLGGCE